MENSELVDLGDALRSWCQTKENKFNSQIYFKALEGYNIENKISYDESIVMSSVGLITLELAIRFLTDYFEESYFQWDNKKYSSSAEHNYTRTLKTLNYYQNISREFVKMKI